MTTGLRGPKGAAPPGLTSEVCEEGRRCLEVPGGERGEDTALAKAATLIEALPWLERFHGQIVVIKYGGHAMTDEALRLAFAQDIVFLRYAGLRPVVVHGGGPQISAHLDKLGMESTFRDGLRVTTTEAMEVVRMVLTGQVNRDVVGLINRHGPFAVGMSGEDAHLLTAHRIQATGDCGEPIDIGHVGEVDSVNPGAISALIADGRIPVISSVARTRDAEVLNVNADTAAAALAVALGAAKLVVLTDVAGLYADWPVLTQGDTPLAGGSPRTPDGPEPPAVLTRGDDPPEPPAVLTRGDDPPEPPAVLTRGDDPPEPPAVLTRGDDPPEPPASGGQAVATEQPPQLISELGVSELAAMLPTLSDGMLPKMTACLTAVNGGVPQAHVLDGRLPHAVLLEIFTDSGIGTMVVPDGKTRAA